MSTPSCVIISMLHFIYSINANKFTEWSFIRMQNKIILASASPRRREILEMANIAYEVIPSDVDENLAKNLKPDQSAIELAILKATAVKTQCKSDVVIIGCDTVVALNNEIFGKPKSSEEAIQILKKLSGRTHQVYTAVCILMNNQIIKTFAECTDVEFYDIADEEIESYVNEFTENINSKPIWKDRAGGYGIQDAFGIRHIKRINGDYYNVMGLPLSRLYYELKRLDNK